MRYRSLHGSPGVDVSILGFGCHRLPGVDVEPDRLDEAAGAALLREALAAGVTYVETGSGSRAAASDELVGRVLRGVPRDAVQLAVKLPLGLVAGERDWAPLLDAQLARLGTERIDLCLLPGLTRGRWDLVRRSGGLAALERARADGRVARLGFSCQGSLELFQEILGAHAWSCCELELDLLGGRSQPGAEALRLAAARGLGVVVAEPLRGNALASPPPIVQEAWSRSARAWSPAQWALRWVWDHAEVVTAVAAPASASQLRESLAAADGAPLSPEDLATIAEVRTVYRTRRRVPCAVCGACQPCASGVAIPDVLSLGNDAMFDEKSGPAAEYRRLLDEGRGGDRCTACTECEPRCPEEIPIVARLREAHAFLTGAGVA